MESTKILVVLMVILLCILVVMFVWNIRLVSRTMHASDSYTSHVLQCYNDAFESDAHNDPVFAALRVQNAITRLETVSVFAGGNAALSQITNIDIDRLHKLLVLQYSQIQSCLPTNKSHPLMEHTNASQ